MTWLLLVASLSGHYGALRLRMWRSLKALGAATVRDGVYAAPPLDTVRTAFDEQLAEIKASGGTGIVFTVTDLSPEDEKALVALFDRGDHYERHAHSVDAFLTQLDSANEIEARRLLRQVQREFAAIDSTDFFPTKTRELALGALQEAERAFSRRFASEEPVAIHATVPRYQKVDFQNRLWATRARLWVDRVCSAWLIRRFIDPGARFQWLEHAADCPKKAIGFDFGGAQFTHVEHFVTFEVLVRSFELDTDVALARIAALVHQLDVGGGRVAEAAGFEAILTGARERCATDDDLLDDMSRVLDDMYRAFSQNNVTETQR
jgi:hypothetical protein